MVDAPPPRPGPRCPSSADGCAKSSVCSTSSTIGGTSDACRGTFVPLDPRSLHDTLIQRELDWIAPVASVFADPHTAGLLTLPWLNELLDYKPALLPIAPSA